MNRPTLRIPGPHGTGRQLLVLRPHVVEVDAARGQELPVREGTAGSFRSELAVSPIPVSGGFQVPVGAQHGLRLPVA